MISDKLQKLKTSLVQRLTAEDITGSPSDVWAIYMTKLAYNIIHNLRVEKNKLGPQVRKQCRGLLQKACSDASSNLRKFTSAQPVH